MLLEAADQPCDILNYCFFNMMTSTDKRAHAAPGLRAASCSNLTGNNARTGKAGGTQRATSYVALHCWQSRPQ